ncbi:hypothetical protein NUW54_g127 [Trametes sanguinea]|uniref:Uncharacterized protein n=1 Tax=Trametes sanguinea TaxID=158606 RepID=A0ACC1QBT3_9APHY|nr:hypothetical protein NUW54_g127 [Trametes sanguinea]
MTVLPACPGFLDLPPCHSALCKPGLDVLQEEPYNASPCNVPRPLEPVAGDDSLRSLSVAARFPDISQQLAILRRTMSAMPITFLPIVSGFDFRHSHDWAQLADRVADWFIAVVDDPRSEVSR